MTPTNGGGGGGAPYGGGAGLAGVVGEPTDAKKGASAQRRGAARAARDSVGGHLGAAFPAVHQFTSSPRCAGHSATVRSHL